MIDTSYLRSSLRVNWHVNGGVASRLLRHCYYYILSPDISFFYTNIKKLLTENDALERGSENRPGARFILPLPLESASILHSRRIVWGRQILASSHISLCSITAYYTCHIARISVSVLTEKFTWFTTNQKTTQKLSSV